MKLHALWDDLESNVTPHPSTAAPPLDARAVAEVAANDARPLSTDVADRLNIALAAEKEAHAETKRRAERAWDQVDDLATENMQVIFPKLAAAESDLAAALADRDRLLRIEEAAWAFSSWQAELDITNIVEQVARDVEARRVRRPPSGTRPCAGRSSHSKSPTNGMR